MARQYKENDLPLDMICMDIDYMQDYADFTVNKQRFPDLAALSAELKAQGIRLVPIMMRVCASTRKTPSVPRALQTVSSAPKPTAPPLWRRCGPARLTLRTSCARRCGSGSAGSTRH